MELRLATDNDADTIWMILQDAIACRKADGSQQWQDGYPNPDTIKSDLINGYGYVLEENGATIAYGAIIFETEPAYEAIEGKWLSDDDYVVIHRVATSKEVKGRGVAAQMFRLIEELAVSKNVYSVKVDTNFDNVPMLKILDRLGYTYCGEVYFRGAPRKAFEKLLR
ncbi:MAG: GNAT family N-acetyltransferase [Chitinophagaceae bacterium]|nr:MAG: GNAT family N-acetyltransferase [Chitinophagaceae bacterium]